MSSDTPEVDASLPATARRWAKVPAARWAVQLLCAGFIALVGFEFNRFYEQALLGRAAMAHRPASVEALLPLSSLLALKRFVFSGRWDDLHPAGLTILLAVIATALLARKAFCGWICPVGTLSRGLEWLGARLRWLRRERPERAPVWSGLAYLPKYLLLGFFLASILVMMDVGSIDEFLASPYNHVADARLLLFFRHPSVIVIVVVGLFVVGSLFVRNLWCRYFCPYGAFLGLFSWASPQRIVRDPVTCIDCKRCTRGCPTGIAVHTQLVVITPECTGCMDCVAVCPVDDCLTVGRRGRKGWSPAWVPVIALAALIAAWLVARGTGHWDSRLPAAGFGEWYRQAEVVSHDADGRVPADAPAPPR